MAFSDYTCVVAFCLKDFLYFLSHVALYQYFSATSRSAGAAFCLELACQLFQIVVAADESCYDRGFFPFAVFLV